MDLIHKRLLAGNFCIWNDIDHGTGNEKFSRDAWEFGFDNFNGLNASRWNPIDGDKDTCFSRKRKDHDYFYALLIPVPQSRGSYADISHIHNYLSIEHLIKDADLQTMDCFDGFTTPGGTTQIVKIKGKNNLWKKLFNLDKRAFENFKPLFQKIDSIFNT